VRGFIRYNQLLIIYATTYHLVWGLLLLTYGESIHFTAATVIAQLLTNYRMQAVVLISVGLIALGGTPIIPSSHVLLRLACLIPQQIVLLLSAISVMQAVVVGHFGDGVVRSWQFIFLDQMQTLLIAILYTVAVLEPSIFALRTKWRLSHDANTQYGAT
jgi:hypothetical protein